MSCKKWRLPILLCQPNPSISSIFVNSRLSMCADFVFHHGFRLLRQPYFGSAGSAMPSILSSTGLKLGSSRGKFTRTPATRNPVQSHKIGHSRQFIALNPCSITKNSVSLHRLAGRRCPFPRRFWATRTDHWGPSVRKVHSLALLSHFAGGQEFVCGNFEETPQRRCQCRFEMQYRYPIFAYDRTL